jgi:hypothetical protein
MIVATGVDFVRAHDAALASEAIRLEMGGADASEG